MFIGRQRELLKLKEISVSRKPAFVAIYGRRRIGKTELVRHFISTQKQSIYLEVTGKYQASTRNQIDSFFNSIRSSIGISSDRDIKNWNDAFFFLQEALEKVAKKKRVVIFFDELPWLDTQKSNFVNELGHFWNTYCSRKNNITLIVCGSAASYIIKKIIHNRGPLHNRVTHKIALQPFRLGEVKEFLTKLGCRYSNRSIVEVFIACGGVAKYLTYLSPQKTVSENIQEMFFSSSGMMVGEYEEMFSSLFKSSKNHYIIMNELAKKWTGYTKSELADTLDLANSTIIKPLEELTLSGFATAIAKFGQEKRDMIYRSVDPYSYFFLKWITGKTTNRLYQTIWQQVAQQPTYLAWSGFAFENICHLHVDEIKQALRISGIGTQSHYWSHRSLEKDGAGVQIDLLLEHTNGSQNIDIIECKFHRGEFVISKKYKEDLLNKIEVFSQQTKYRYNLRLILLTSGGIKRNEHFNELQCTHISMDRLLNSL